MLLFLFFSVGNAAVVCGDYEYDAGAFVSGTFNEKRRFSTAQVEWTVEPPFTLTLMGDVLTTEGGNGGQPATGVTLTFGEFAASYPWAMDVLRQYSRLRTYAVAYIRVIPAEPSTSRSCLSRHDIIDFYWDAQPLSNLFAAYPVRCNERQTLQFSIDPMAHPVEDAWGKYPQAPRDGKHFYPSGGLASFSTAITMVNLNKPSRFPLTVAYYSGVLPNVTMLVMRTCTDVDVDGLASALTSRYNETRVEMARVSRDAADAVPAEDTSGDDPDEWAKDQLRKQGVQVDLPALGKLAPPEETRAPRPPGLYDPEAVDADAEIVPGKQIAEAEGLVKVQGASDAQQVVMDGRLWPTLDCVEHRDDGTCVAAFGYVSSYPAGIDVAVAKQEQNWFDPQRFLTDFELPTHFEPGSHRNAFVIRWFCVGDTIASFNNIYWTLQGSTASATSTTAPCGTDTASDDALAAALGDVDAARNDLPARRKLFSFNEERSSATVEPSSNTDPENNATDPPVEVQNTGPPITINPPSNVTDANQNGTDPGGGNNGQDCGINSQSDGTIGYSSVNFATPDTDNGNSAEVTLVETIYGGPVTSMWIYVSTLDPDVNYRGFQMAIYNGTADTPGSLVGVTDFGILQNVGWNTLNMTAVVTLAAHSYYWFGYNTNASATNTNNAYNLNLPGANVFWKRHSFSLGWPDVYFSQCATKNDVQGHVMFATTEHCQPTTAPPTTAPPTTAAPSTAPPSTPPPPTTTPPPPPTTTAPPSTTAPPPPTTTTAPLTTAPATTTPAPTCATNSGSCDGDLQPRIECTHNFENGTCITYFGYRNLDNITVSRAATFSHNNYFTPIADDQGQPTTFSPGRQYWIFSVRWSCPPSTSGSPTSITWVLNTTATAGSATHNTCPVGCDDVPLSNKTDCPTTPPPTTPDPTYASSTSPAVFSSSSSSAGTPPSPPPPPPAYSSSTGSPYVTRVASSSSSASAAAASYSSSTGNIPTPCPTASPCRFSASLVLYRDRNFTKPYRPPHQIGANTTAYGLVSLDVPTDWLPDFCLNVTRVTECICNSTYPCLPFKPTSPGTTGCNSPGIQKRVVHRFTGPPINIDGFAFVTDPPTYCSGERAFGWTMHLFAPPGHTLLVQAEWEYSTLHGESHSCPGSSEGGSGAAFTCGCPDTFDWDGSCSCCKSSSSSSSTNVNNNNNTNDITIWNIVEDQSGAGVSALAAATASVAVATATASATATTASITVVVKQAADWPLWLAVGLLAGLIGIPLLLCAACALWLCGAAGVVAVAPPVPECEMMAEVVPVVIQEDTYTRHTDLAVQELYNMSGGSRIYQHPSTGQWVYGAVPQHSHAS